MPLGSSGRLHYLHTLLRRGSGTGTHPRSAWKIPPASSSHLRHRRGTPGPKIGPETQWALIQHFPLRFLLTCLNARVKCESGSRSGSGARSGDVRTLRHRSLGLKMTFRRITELLINIIWIMLAHMQWTNIWTMDNACVYSTVININIKSIISTLYITSHLLL